MPNLTGFFKKLIVTTAIALLPLFVYGYDFSSLPSNLSQSVKQSGTPIEELRIALLFKVTNKKRVQKRFNIVELKRDLANELVQYYQMTDPLIVAQILQINTLTYEDLGRDKNLIAKVGKKAGASHLAFAQFQLRQERLVLDFQLVDLAGDKIGHIQMVIPPQQKKSGNTSQERAPSRDPARTREQLPLKGSTSNFFETYNAPPINDQLNDSWVYFSPTAFLNPRINFLELSFWPKDFVNTEFILVQARYGFTMKRYFTLGSLSYGNGDGSYHSHYAYAKIKLFNAPLSTVAIGLKRRLAWNPENTDFKSDNEVVDEKNLSRNELTLQGIASGWYKKLGLFWNFYIDNQNVGFGGKILLTSEIKLLVDSVFHYYENTKKTGDQALGIQFNNLSGGISTLSYQSSNEQTRLSLGFSW